MKRTRAATAAAVVAVTVAVLVLGGGVLIGVTQTNSPYGRFGAPLDVDPDSAVANAIEGSAGALSSADLRRLRYISRQPTSVWVGGGLDSVTKVVTDAVAGATKRDAIATLVAYNIPDRDCGGHSATAETVAATDYERWVDGFADGLTGARTIVIVEPDALAQLDCLDADARSSRLELLRYAVNAFVATGAWVYLDAGHSGWLPVARIAADLRAAGVASATGFSLNVSNFKSTADEVGYGEAIAERLPSPAHFVIDTSRNGLGVSDGVWCNPPGAALGVAPTVGTASDLVDAYLWVKTPGLSDGECNGGPAAGRWWVDYAMGLVNNARVSGS